MYKTALIFGITGQDGAYLSEFLLKKGYEVFGVTRKLTTLSVKRLKNLGIFDKVNISTLKTYKLNELKRIIDKINPNEIYNLSGVSSVGYSFINPVETFESITKINLNILEVIKQLNSSIRFYNACSSECFGDTNKKCITENTKFSPLSPYGFAKASSFWQVFVYRKVLMYLLVLVFYLITESPLRKDIFVTKKIISVAKELVVGVKKNSFWEILILFVTGDGRQTMWKLCG